MMNNFKFLQPNKLRPIIPEEYRWDDLLVNVFVQGWEAAERGEHGIRTRYGGGNPYVFEPLKSIWLSGWRDYLNTTIFD